MTRSLFPFVCAVVLAAGCGGGDRPKLVPATGKVAYNGQPLTAGSLTFHPAPGLTFNGDRPSSVLQVDGSFAMRTYPHGDGAPPGSYKATLSNELATRIKRPDYADPTKTPLSVDVPEGGLRDHTFDVK